MAPYWQILFIENEKNIGLCNFEKIKIFHKAHFAIKIIFILYPPEMSNLFVLFDVLQKHNSCRPKCTCFTNPKY